MILEWVRIDENLEESSGNGEKRRKLDQVFTGKFYQTFKKETMTILTIEIAMQTFRKQGKRDHFPTHFMTKSYRQCKIGKSNAKSLMNTDIKILNK